MIITIYSGYTNDYILLGSNHAKFKQRYGKNLGVCNLDIVQSIRRWSL